MQALIIRWSVVRNAEWSSAAAASASFVKGVRAAAGSERDASHVFAPAERSARTTTGSGFGPIAPAANRQAMRQASTSSLSPPMGARPASAASAGKRNEAVASEYGGVASTREFYRRSLQREEP